MAFDAKLAGLFGVDEQQLYPFLLQAAIGTAAASPGSSGLQPLASGLGGAYSHLARMQDIRQKKENASLYKQQVEAQMAAVQQAKERQEAQQKFAQEIAGRVDPNLGPAQQLTPQQIIYMGLARGVVSPLEAAKELKGSATSNRPFNVGPQGALVSPTGEELYRNPAQRGSGVLRDPATGLPMVPGDDGVYQPLPGFTPRPVRTPGESGRADPYGKLPTGKRWIDPNNKALGVEPIPGTEKTGKKDSGTASLDLSLKLIDDMQNLVKLGEGTFKGVTGVKGAGTRIYETGKGLVSPMSPAPALTFKAKKELLLGQVRTMFDSGVLSKDDKARMDSAVGGDIFSTPLTTLESLETLKNAIGEIRSEKKGVVTNYTGKVNTQGDKLTAEEQAELEALRKRFKKK